MIFGRTELIIGESGAENRQNSVGKVRFLVAPQKFAKIPKKIIKKVTKAAEVLNLGITDYEKYASRKFDGDQNNNQYKKKNARMHTHQDALAIDTLMEIITGIKLETDPTYLRKRPKSGIDDLIGFNANCIKK